MADAQIVTSFDYEGFSQRLKEAMFPEKVTAFAERVGLPQGTVSKYLGAGGSAGPRLDIVARMADGLGVTLDWLAFGRGDAPDELRGVVKIARYDATLAAGAGSWNAGRRKLDDIPFTSDFLRKRLNRTSAAGLSVLTAVGDSMEPNIDDGSLVLVDEQDTRLIDGIFAFVLDEEARIKRFRRLLDGVLIMSDNPTYPPEEVRGDRMKALQIIGRVRWIAKLV